MIAGSSTLTGQSACSLVCGPLFDEAVAAPGAGVGDPSSNGRVDLGPPRIDGGGLGADGYGDASFTGLDVGGAFIAEVVLTFIFVSVVLAVTSKSATTVASGPSIGLALRAIAALVTLYLYPGKADAATAKEESAQGGHHEAANPRSAPGSA